MKIKILSENVGRCLTKNYREDMAELVQQFRHFVHISQFENVSRNTTKLPIDRAVVFRVDGSPVVGIGEMMFGMDPEGTMTWLAEIIDSSD